MSVLLLCCRHLTAPSSMTVWLPSHSTLQAIRMEEGAKGRKLSVQERHQLLTNPLKLLQAVLPSVGTLYSGLKPAAVETAASNAVSH
jgi:hypothetical protein